MLISDIIHSALRKIGAVASGETVEPEEQKDSLEALQIMLRSWSVEQINVFSLVTETHTLVGGTTIYSWGEGGTINTIRPNEVVDATIDDSSGVTHPVTIISEGQYRNITVKGTSSRPYYLYPQYTYPYVTIKLYPTPSDAETLNLYSLKPFTETSSFDSVDDTLAMPVSYQEPIIYNLAIRMAPEFGRAIPVTVAAIATSSYDRLIARNAANHFEPVVIILPVRAYGRYSINSDSYR